MDLQKIRRAMAGKTKTRMNPLKIIGILIILILLTQFSKIKSFAA